MPRLTRKKSKKRNKLKKNRIRKHQTKRNSIRKRKSKSKSKRKVLSGGTLVSPGIELSETEEIIGSDKLEEIKSNPEKNIITYAYKTFKDDETLLYIAAKNSEHDLVRNILEFYDEDGGKETVINKKNNKGETPLFIASHNNQADIVSTLLENGANPNLQTTEGLTPLYVAAQKGFDGIVKVLMNFNQSGVESSVESDVESSVESDVESSVEKNKLDPNLGDNSGSNPLIIAAQMGHLKVVKELLCDDRLGNCRGANINEKKKIGGGTALFSAAKFNKDDVIDYLLEKGANFAIPFNHALENIDFDNNLQVVNNLLMKATEEHLKKEDDDYLTPLLCATKCAAEYKGTKSQDELFRILGKLIEIVGADHKNSENITPLIMLAGIKNDNILKVAELLIDKEADIDLIMERSNGELRYELTALYSAVFHMNENFIHFLLEKGAYPCINFKRRKRKVSLALEAQLRHHRDTTPYIPLLKKLKDYEKSYRC